MNHESAGSEKHSVPTHPLDSSGRHHGPTRSPCLISGPHPHPYPLDSARSHGLTVRSRMRLAPNPNPSRRGGGAGISTSGGGVRACAGTASCLARRHEQPSREVPRRGRRLALGGRRRPVPPHQVSNQILRHPHFYRVLNDD